MASNGPENLVGTSFVASGGFTPSTAPLMKMVGVSICCVVLMLCSRAADRGSGSASSQRARYEWTVTSAQSGFSHAFETASKVASSYQPGGAQLSHMRRENPFG